MPDFSNAKFDAAQRRFDDQEPPEDDDLPTDGASDDTTDDAQELAEYRAQHDELAAILDYTKEAAPCMADLVAEIKLVVFHACTDLRNDIKTALDDGTECMVCGCADGRHTDDCTVDAFFTMLEDLGK